MSGLTPEQRESEEKKLTELAQTLREFSTSTAAQDLGHSQTILGFAEEAEKFAKMIREAVTPELAAAFAAKATKKAAGWQELTTMLQYAALVEGPDGEATAKLIQEAAVEEAEAKLRATATQLRGVSAGGNTAVFRAIAEIAASAEAGLEEFLAAGSAEEKLDIYQRVEESRTQWLQQMETMQTAIVDGGQSEGPTEAPDPNDVEVEEFQDAMEDPFEKAWGAMQKMGAFSADQNFGRGGRPAAKASASAASSGAVAKAKAAPAKPTVGAPPSAEGSTPGEARAQMVAYLQGEDGFLASLKKAVEGVKADDRFEGVHADAASLLEQMETAATAVLTNAPAGGSGPEEQMTSTVELLRRAQTAAMKAKKLAFEVQKYDLYKRTGSQPRLADEHVNLLECGRLAVDLAEFCRKQSQELILESVAGLVAQVGADTP